MRSTERTKVSTPSSRRMALCIVVSVTACSSASAPADRSTLTGDAGAQRDDDLSSSAGSTAQHEPTIAVTAGGRVLVTWIAAVGTRANGRPRRVIQFRVSEDRGLTYGTIGTVPVADDQNGGNSWAAAGPGEALYIASGAVRRSEYNAILDVRLLLSRSRGPGMAFETTDVTSAADGEEVRDQPRVEIVGTHVLYSFWAAGPSPAGRFAAALDAHVERWTSLPASGNVRVCRGAGDSIYAVVSDQVMGVTLFRSDTGGATWRPSVVLSAEAGVPTPGGCVASDGGVYVLVPAASPGTTPRGGALVFVHGASDKVEWRTELQGGAWLSDFGVLDGRASVFGYLEASGGVGALGRFIIGPGGAIERSWDELVPNLHVSEAVFDGDAARFQPPWPGDYLGVATTGGRHWVAFTNNYDGVARAALRSLTP